MELMEERTRSFQCEEPVVTPGFPSSRCRKCTACLRWRGWSWVRRAVAEIYTQQRTDVVRLSFRDRGALSFSSRGPERQKYLDRIAYDDVKLWLKRIRKSQPNGYRLRYMCCAEFGPRTGRLHYHVLLSCSGHSAKGYGRAIKRAWKQGQTHFKLLGGLHAARYCADYAAKSSHIRPRASQGYGSQGRTALVNMHKTGILDALEYFPEAAGLKIVAGGGSRAGIVFPSEMHLDREPYSSRMSRVHADDPEILELLKPHLSRTRRIEISDAARN